MEKNLPIKIFKKRDNDKLPNLIPGGGSEGNKFKLQGAELLGRANYFRSYFSRLGERVKQKVETENYLPTIVKIRLNDDALAKAYRKEIGKIFNLGRTINLIGFLGDNQLLIKIDNPNDLALIEARIKDSQKNVLGISAIEEAEDFKPIVDLKVDEVADLKVKLINYGDYKWNEVAKRNFEKLCERLEVKYQKLNYTKDLILYRVSNIKPQALTDFNESESIFSISKVPIIQLSRGEFIDDGKIEIKKPEKGTDYFKIGIFDEGISDIKHLKEWKEASYNDFPEGQYDKLHGTFVAGIINYGDSLEGKDWTGTKPFKITEAVVFPNSKYGWIDENMMVDYMRKAIIQNPEVRVWNFSLGHLLSISDDQYSDFANFLDELQDEYNILIVKAAGNCRNFEKGAPRGRITLASESIRTLVVGSLAHEKNEHDLADVNHPSPFSVVGPGISDVIKPDLVHYGGNAGMKNGEIKISGVRSFHDDGRIRKDVGTSYSAPRVAALAAELAGSLKEEFNPLLIKALLIHSAKHPEEFEAPLEDRLSQIGFGLPTKIGDILFNDPNEVTLILMDSVDKGSHIKIMDFPFPQSLIENGFYYGQIKITLASAPKVDAYQGGEYVQSDVDVSFGTYARKVEVVDSKVKRYPIDIEDADNLLSPKLFGVREQKSATSLFKSERLLKSYKDGYKDQFVPVKKWCFDLNELSPANHKLSLPKDRLWFLKLKAGYRDSFESRIKDSKDISQEFALIITIKDTKKKGTVYNEVTKLLSQFNFIHENIKVDERVIIK